MAQEEAGDPGLGLSEFLGTKNEPTTPVEEKVETKVEATPADKPEVKAAEPKRLDTNPKGSVEAKDVKEPKAKAEAKPKVEGPNWDDETNPWKKKAAEFEKRYKDTHTDWNRLNQEKLKAEQQQQALAQQVAILNEKFDGTYDPAKYEQRVDPEHLRYVSSIEGKVQASLAAVMDGKDEGGQAEVMDTLQEFAKLFGQNKAVQQEVLASAHPVQAAIKAVKSAKFYQTYGSDPDSILQKFRAEFETNELPKIVEEQSKKVRAELAKQQPREPAGISNVQGGSGAMDKSVARDNAGRFKPLTGVFGR